MKLKMFMKDKRNEEIKEYEIPNNSKLVLKEYIKIPFLMKKIEIFEQLDKHTLLLDHVEVTAKMGEELIDLTKIFKELK